MTVTFCLGPAVSFIPVWLPDATTAAGLALIRLGSSPDESPVEVSIEGGDDTEGLSSKLPSTVEGPNSMRGDVVLAFMSGFEGGWISVFGDSDVELTKGERVDVDTFETLKERELEEETNGEKKDEDVDTGLPGLLSSAAVIELAKDLFKGIVEEKVGATDCGIDDEDRGADDELIIGDEGAETDTENVVGGGILSVWLLFVAASVWANFPGSLAIIGTENEGENGKSCFFPASVDAILVVKGPSFTISFGGSAVSLAYEFSISFCFFCKDSVCVDTLEDDGF